MATDALSWLQQILGGEPPDERGDGKDALGQLQQLAYVPFDKTAQTGSDYFAGLVPRAAAAALPAGYSAIPTSGYRPGAVAADTGRPSQHASGGALDYAVLDPQGRTVTGAGLGNPDPTGYYRAMALAMRRFVDPDYQPWMAWGGNFGRIDPGHVDFGGDRGSRGTLGRMAQ